MSMEVSSNYKDHKGRIYAKITEMSLEGAVVKAPNSYYV